MLKSIALFASLFFVSICCGQENMCHSIDSSTNMCTHYNRPLTLTTGDNTPNAKVLNVWHAVVGAPALIQRASGTDSSGNVKHYGITSTGAVWEYLDYWAPSNPNTWVQHPEMGTVSALGVGLTGIVWSLQSTSFCTGVKTGSFGVFKWTGSAWTQPSPTGACVMQFSPAQDGTLTGIGTDTFIYESTNTGVLWSKVTGAGSGWKYVATSSVGRSIGVKVSDQSVWTVMLPSGTLTAMGGGTAKPPAVDSNTRVYVVGTDSFIYRYNGTGWDKFLGSGFTSISTCGLTCTFALKSGGNSYRFPDVTMIASGNLNGNTTCTDNFGAPKPCPPSSHTPQASVKFNLHSLNGGQTVFGPAVSPETAVNVTAMDVSYDPYDCFDQGFGSTSCLSPSGQLPTQANVNCSIVGVIYAGGFIPGGQSSWHIAQTRIDDGSGTTCFKSATFQCGAAGDDAGCVYSGPYNYYCDQGVNPNPGPDYTFTKVTGCTTNGSNPPGPNPNIWGFDTSGPCYYPVPGGSPLLCIHDPLPGGFGSGPLGKKMLDINIVPRNTKGLCTILGVKQ